MKKLKNNHEEICLSPKSFDIDSESKIRMGAASRGKLFYDIDQSPFQKKSDLQESLHWSDKNSSISMSKTGINMIQNINQHNEIDAFSKAQIMELDYNYQNKTASKSNITILNINQHPSQLQILQNQSPNDKMQVDKAINTSKSFNQGEKKDSSSPLPLKEKEQKLRKTLKNFKVMMLAKKFQDIMLNKSQSYLFRKTLNDRISFQLLRDKAFIWEDFKRQIAMNISKNFSNAKFIFDVLAFLFILMNIAYLPLKHSYNSIFNLFQHGFIEKITLYFLLVEGFVNMNTQFYSQGLLVKDQFTVIKNYLQGRLWIDLIVGIPYLLSQIHPNLEFLNLFYLIRFLDFLIIFNKIEDKFLKNSHFGDAIKCIFLIFFVAHLSACIIYVISTLPKPDYERTYLDSIDVDRTQWLQVYIYSFYWSIITMTTIGYGDIHPNSHRERVYAAFFAILSCVVFGFTLNQIGSIISNIYMNSNMIRKKQAIIDSYLKKRNVSPDLQVKVKKNIEYILMDSGQQDKVVEELLNSLTVSLKSQLKIELYQNILSKIQTFRINFSEKFLQELCNLFQEQTFNQEQYLYYEGDLPDKFYFVIRGEVELFYQQFKCPCTIKKKESLGVEEFITQQSRVQSAKASRVTTVAYICYEDFNELLKKYQKDMETYRMIYDSFNVNKLAARILVRCQNCQSVSHVTSECPYLFCIRNLKKKIQKSEIENILKPEINERQSLEILQLKQRHDKKFKSIAQCSKVWNRLFEFLCQNIDQVELYYDNMISLQNNQSLDSQEEEGEGGDGDDDNENYEQDEYQEDNQRMKQTGTTVNSLKSGENTPYRGIIMFKSQHMNKQAQNNQSTSDFSDKQKESLAKYLFSGQAKSNSAIDFQQIDQFAQPQNQQGQDIKDNMQQLPSVIQNMFDVTQKKDPNQPNIFIEQLKDTQNNDPLITPTNSNQKNLLQVANQPSKDNTSFSFAQQSSFQKEEEENKLNNQQIRLHQNSSQSSDKSNITFMNMNQNQNSNPNQNNFIQFTPQINQSHQQNIQQIQLDKSKNLEEPIKIHNKRSSFTEGNQALNNNSSSLQVNSNSNSSNSYNHNVQKIQSHPEIQKLESNFTNMNSNSKSLSNLNSLSNQNINTPQQSSAVETFKRKSSYFSSYHKRKTSEIKRDDQSHSKLLMPVTNNQFSAIIDDSTPSHQMPHGTAYNTSLINYQDTNNNRATTNSNNLNPSSGQSNINPMSNLLLEPISPIKQKQENTSPMLTMNKEIFTNSELQFDIQTDQLSPRRKQYQLFEKQNHQQQPSKLIQAYQVQNTYDKDGKKRQNTIQPTYSNLDEVFFQNYQNKSQQNAFNPDNSNSVSIRLDDQDPQSYQQQQQYMYDKNLEQTRYFFIGENSSRGQSTRQLSIKKGANKTALIFGQQPLEMEQQNSFQQTQYSTKNYEENYNTSQSYLQNNNIHETTNDYHPSFQGRKKTHRITQNDIWNEKISTLQSDIKKDRLQSYLQSNNSQRNIRSQRNIQIANRKQRRDDSITRTLIQQQNSELLSQSQDYPKESIPGLFKYQSAKVKVPTGAHPQQSFQISQMQLHDQQINMNKKLLETNLSHKNQSQSNIKLNQNHKQSSHGRQHSIIKNGENQSMDSLEHNNQSSEARTQKYQRKFTNKKISFKITEDPNTVRDSQRNHTYNSIMQNQTLIPYYNLRGEDDDDERNSEEDQFKFSLILDFDCMKQYVAYFPWNNYNKVIKNMYGFKKKKNKEMMTLFSTKQMTKAVRTKFLSKGEKENSDGISKTYK